MKKELNLYFSYKGRIGRIDFILANIKIFLCDVFFGIVAVEIHPIFWSMLFFNIISRFMINIKRFHDLEEPAWISIILFSVFNVSFIMISSNISFYKNICYFVYIIFYISLVFFTKGTVGQDKNLKSSKK